MELESNGRTSEVEALTFQDRRTVQRIGQTIAGKYRLESLIGLGGAGEVYLASCSSPDQRVAIKLLHPHLASGSNLQRFYREARSAASLKHPGIVEVFDLGKTEDGSPYLAMDFLDGWSVIEYCATARLQIGQALCIARDTLDALAYSHARGIIHRDLKPGNLYLARCNDTVATKVLDFGIAKLVFPGETVLTETGQMFGTPGYMSPEQLADFKRVDFRTDIYAVGALLYYLLIGQSPLGGGNTNEILKKLFRCEIRRHPKELRSDIPDWLDALIASALAKDIGDRPRSASEFRTAIEAGLCREGIDPAESLRQIRRRLDTQERPRLADAEAATEMTPAGGASPEDAVTLLNRANIASSPATTLVEEGADRIVFEAHSENTSSATVMAAPRAATTSDQPDIAVPGPSKRVFRPQLEALVSPHETHTRGMTDIATEPSSPFPSGEPERQPGPMSQPAPVSRSLPVSRPLGRLILALLASLCFVALGALLLMVLS